MRAFAIVLALLAATGAVRAAEINAFISTAIKAATDELLPPFERANGHTIRASYAPSGALIPRFERGEPVDVFLTDAPAIDSLIQQGKIVGGRTDLARTGIGICVRKGAPKPDVSTPDALKRALLAAKTVGHAAPAGGSITAADSDLPAMLNLAVSGMSDMKTIAVTINRLEHIFVSRKNITKPEELKGKRLAVSRLGSASDFVTRMVLRTWKVDPEKEVTLLQAATHRCA